MSVEERVLKVIAKIAQNDEVLNDPELQLFETGLLDSFATVELLLALEEEFDTPFSPAEFDPETWATPRLIAGIVAERLG